MKGMGGAMGYTSVSELSHELETLLDRLRTGSLNVTAVIMDTLFAGVDALEEAVAREVLEEAGIEIEDITYSASQPWPFPSQLMVGFTARHRSGEIKLEDSEILDAAWFEPLDLPQLPGRFSLARHLIDDFLDRRGIQRERSAST